MKIVVLQFGDSDTAIVMNGKMNISTIRTYYTMSRSPAPLAVVALQRRTFDSTESFTAQRGAISIPALLYYDSDTVSILSSG